MENNTTNLIFNNDVLNIYQEWQSPICIVSDGPYGISGYEGDAKKPQSLVEMYEPHIQAWTKAATSQTTLWFWNTEVGWATIHLLLEKYGWIYKGCNVWDKGIKHIAGNCNGKTMRKFPVVTEVCVQYVRKEVFTLKNGNEISLQEWLRSEWKKTGLSFQEANTACGVKNAASRKYLASDHLWYFPPSEEFQKMVDYANTHGKLENKPYFSLNGKDSLSKNQWDRIRAKFNFEYGVTNVWTFPPLRSKERLKDGTIISHPNQKPLELMDRIILASTDKNDIVWEPFAGTASASISAMNNERLSYACEINKNYYDIALSRLKNNERN